jgi:hypothetical protein
MQTETRKARQEHRETVEPSPAPNPADTPLSLIEAVKAADAGMKQAILDVLVGTMAAERDWEQEEPEDDGSDPFSDCLPTDDFVMECDLPGCIMPGPHFKSECHTVEMLEAQEAEAATCFWREVDSNWGLWTSSCGKRFNFSNDGPNDSGFRFCPYCGVKLAEETVQGEEGAGIAQ